MSLRELTKKILFLFLTFGVDQLFLQSLSQIIKNLLLLISQPSYTFGQRTFSRLFSLDFSFSDLDFFFLITLNELNIGWFGLVRGSLRFWRNLKWGSLDIQNSEAILLLAFFWFGFLRDLSSYCGLIWAVELDLILWSTLVRPFWHWTWSFVRAWSLYWQHLISESVASIRWIWANLLKSDDFLKTLGSCVLLLR